MLQDSFMRYGRRFLIAALVFLTIGGAASAEDFALRDGDTVIFLGDSITAARSYGKMIENYTLLRFPKRKIRFVNAGIGGDTAAGGLKRIQRDVFDAGATVLIVAFGTNDIGWGVLADDEHKQKYLDAVKGIVGECKKRDVRVYICSAAIMANDPDQGEQSYLQKMCDEGMALSRSLGGEAIDVQRMMRDIQRRVIKSNVGIKETAKQNTMHAGDGVHLNDLGQFAMAYAILKGLNAPAMVSSATVDAAGGQVVDSPGCEISNIVSKDRHLEFTRLDECLPFNYGLFFALHYRFVPMPAELNQYMLAVKNLPAGRYAMTADDRGIGTFTAAQLSEGMNISWATANAWEPGGPWNAQANSLVSLTNARHELATAGLLTTLHVGPGKLLDDLAKGSVAANEQLESLQRLMARPRPYRFVIRPEEKAP